MVTNQWRNMQNEIVLREHDFPLMPGEIQICTEGLRVSSFELDDDLPVMGKTSAEVLMPALIFKRAFDERALAINEPEEALPEPEVDFNDRRYFRRYHKLSDTELARLEPTDTATLINIVRSLNRMGPKLELSDEWYARAVHTLAWFLKAGYRVNETVKDGVLDPATLVRLYSEVNKNETKMSDKAFFSTWSDEAAHVRLRIRIEKGVLPDASGKILVKQKRTGKIKNLVCIKCGEVFKAVSRNTKKCSACGGPPDPSKRYCALGPRCLREERGRPHVCLTRSPYCSEGCLGRFQAAVARSRKSHQDARTARQPIEVGQTLSQTPSEPSNLAGF